MPRAGKVCRSICRTKDAIEMTALLLAGIATRGVEIGQVSEIDLAKRGLAPGLLGPGPVLRAPDYLVRRAPY
jgi:hypothetical protein